MPARILARDQHRQIKCVLEAERGQLLRRRLGDEQVPVLECAAEDREGTALRGRLCSSPGPDGVSSLDPGAGKTDEEPANVKTSVSVFPASSISSGPDAAAFPRRRVLTVEVIAMRRLTKWALFLAVPLLLMLAVSAAASTPPAGKVKRTKGEIETVAMDGSRVVYSTEFNGVYSWTFAPAEARRWRSPRTATGRWCMSSLSPESESPGSRAT